MYDQIQMYSQGQVCFKQVRLSSGFPLQLLANRHNLTRVSVPSPQVTGQVHLDQDDQAIKRNLSDQVLNILLMLSFSNQVYYQNYFVFPFLSFLNLIKFFG